MARYRARTIVPHPHPHPPHHRRTRRLVDSGLGDSEAWSHLFCSPALICPARGRRPVIARHRRRPHGVSHGAKGQGARGGLVLFVWAGQKQRRDILPGLGYQMGRIRIDRCLQRHSSAQNCRLWPHQNGGGRRDTNLVCAEAGGINRKPIGSIFVYVRTRARAVIVRMAAVSGGLGAYRVPSRSQKREGVPRSKPAKPARGPTRRGSADG